MAFNYKTGMSMGVRGTSSSAKGSQSGKDLVKNIRAGMKLGKKK